MVSRLLVGLQHEVFNMCGVIFILYCIVLNACHVEMSPSLLSTIQRYQRHNLLPLNVTHPFASSAEASYALLQDLTLTADQLVNSLNIYAAPLLSNPKLVSLLRQHSSIIYTSHQVRPTVSYSVYAIFIGDIDRQTRAHKKLSMPFAAGLPCATGKTSPQVQFLL